MRYIILVLLIIVGIILALFAEACIGLMPIESYDIPIVLNGTIEYSDAVCQLIGNHLGGLVGVTVSLIVFAWLLGLYRNLSRKHRTKSTSDITKIKTPFILYLRSFADEKSTQKTIRRISDNRTEEEMLIDAFTDIAPVYAIGDPADKKMPYGANRIYVDDSVWKSTVETLALNAEIVILRLGQTNNFWWEVNMALKNVPVGKLVFVIPWSKTFNNVSTLYKILLEHGIDISKLNVAIDKKRYGSISSVLFFIDNKPSSREIVLPRFTGLFLSYDNLLRNALSSFREGYGFKTTRRLPILKSRILYILLLLISIVGCGGRFFGNLMELKYQRPYDVVKECVKDADFTSKYGSEINGTNLSWVIVGSVRGKLLLKDQDFIKMLLIEQGAMKQMSVSEADVLNQEPFNALLIIKKYSPEHYQEYIEITAKAALYWVKDPEAASNALTYYKQNIDNLPLWVNSFMSEYSEVSEDEFDRLWNDESMKHIDEPDFAETIKTLMAQVINPE